MIVQASDQATLVDGIRRHLRRAYPRVVTSGDAVHVCGDEGHYVIVLDVADDLFPQAYVTVTANIGDIQFIPPAGSITQVADFGESLSAQTLAGEVLDAIQANENGPVPMRAGVA